MQRYAELIRAALASRASTPSAAGSDEQIDVACGVAYLDGVMRRDRDAERTTPFDDVAIRVLDRLAQGLPVVDLGGRARSLHRPLLIYALLQSYLLARGPRIERLRGRWERGFGGACESLAAAMLQTEDRGAAVAESAWRALALGVAGEAFDHEAWSARGAETFEAILRNQSPSGAFLHADPSRHPEAHWFDELTLLHAVASRAALTGDGTLCAAVARAAEYHQAETEPGHATSQPWGLLAFIVNPHTRGVADQMLHAVALPRGEGPDAVSIILLADALHCLRRFI